MRCGLTCAPWEAQESISGIGGLTWPGSVNQWQSVVYHHTVWTRWGAWEPKWNANTGHIGQGSLIGTQLLQGPSIPWSPVEAQEPVGHHDQVRFSLCAAQNTWPKMPGGRKNSESLKEQRHGKVFLNSFRLVHPLKDQINHHKNLLWYPVSLTSSSTVYVHLNETEKTCIIDRLL